MGRSGMGVNECCKAPGYSFSLVSLSTLSSTVGDS